MPTTFTPNLHLVQHSVPERLETGQQTTFDSPTARQFDLRIIAFMVIVGGIQLLTFKRPLS